MDRSDRIVDRDPAHVLTTVAENAAAAETKRGQHLGERAAGRRQCRLLGCVL